MANWRWLLPGLRLKRWVLVLCVGVVFVVFGAIALGVAFFDLETDTGIEETIDFHPIGWTAVGFGMILVFTGVYRLVRSIEKLLRQEHEKRGIAEIALDRARREFGAKIVCLGGGTGLSTLLTGLKSRAVDITAVVSVADDGGSSGRLRKDFDTLPPGDIRNCLTALADAGPIMRDLMQYRFDSGEFAGHSFGNLFIMVLAHICGDFGRAVLETNRILSVRGRVLPASLDRVSLVAAHPDGTKTTGQRNIARCGREITGLELKPAPPHAPEEVLAAVGAADMIVLGPGSLYTSVLPNLLEREVAAALAETDAVTVFIVNTMTQPGETDGFGVEDHLAAFRRHAPDIRLDAVLVNSYRPGARKLEECAERGVEPTEYDRKALEGESTRVFLRDVIDYDHPVRHDPEKLAEAVLEIYGRLRDEKR